MMKKKVLRMIAHLILILTKYLTKKYPWRKQDDLRIFLKVVSEKFPLHDDDEKEIEVEGEGGTCGYLATNWGIESPPSWEPCAPTKKAKIGTLKAEANDLCTHRYRHPYCESCIRAKMKHFRTRQRSIPKRIESMG